MSYLQSFREQFHLSQSAFASLLGVSTSLLSMVELEQRRLPVAANARLIRLQEMYTASMEASAKSEQSDMELPTERELSIKSYQELISECEFQQERTRRQLAPLKKKREKALATLALVEQVLKFDETAGHVEWAAMMRQAAIRQLQAASQIKIELLELKLLSFRQQVEEATRRITESTLEPLAEEQ